MPKIIVGLSRKRPGPEQYSSDGYHLTVELDTEITSPTDFQESVRSLFSEVKGALDAEIAHNGGQSAPQTSGRSNLWTGNSGGNGNRPTQRADAGHQSGGNGNGNGNGIITKKQMKYLVELGAKRGMPNQADLESWIRKDMGIENGLFKLTLSEASRCIDALRAQTGAR